MQNSGSANTSSQAPAAGGLFGKATMSQPTGGLFGQAQTTQPQTTQGSGLFGVVNNRDAASANRRSVRRCICCTTIWRTIWRCPSLNTTAELRVVWWCPGGSDTGFYGRDVWISTVSAAPADWRRALWRCKHPESGKAFFLVCTILPQAKMHAVN